MGVVRTVIDGVFHGGALRIVIRPIAALFFELPRGVLAAIALHIVFFHPRAEPRRAVKNLAHTLKTASVCVFFVPCKADRKKVARKVHGFKEIVVGESLSAEVSHAVRDRDLTQAVCDIRAVFVAPAENAALKGERADLLQAVRQNDGSQIVAPAEGGITDAGNAIGHFDLGDIPAQCFPRLGVELAVVFVVVVIVHGAGPIDFQSIALFPMGVGRLVIGRVLHGGRLRVVIRPEAALLYQLPGCVLAAIALHIVFFHPRVEPRRAVKHLAHALEFAPFGCFRLARKAHGGEAAREVYGSQIFVVGEGLPRDIRNARGDGDLPQAVRGIPAVFVPPARNAMLEGEGPDLPQALRQRNASQLIAPAKG